MITGLPQTVNDALIMLSDCHTEPGWLTDAYAALEHTIEYQVTTKLRQRKARVCLKEAAENIRGNRGRG